MGSAMCSNMALGCEKQQLSSLIAKKLAKLSDDPDFPREAVEELLELLPIND